MRTAIVVYHASYICLFRSQRQALLGRCVHECFQSPVVMGSWFLTLRNAANGTRSVHQVCCGNGCTLLCSKLTARTASGLVLVIWNGCTIRCFRCTATVLAVCVE